MEDDANDLLDPAGGNKASSLSEPQSDTSGESGSLSSSAGL